MWFVTILFTVLSFGHEASPQALVYPPQPMAVITASNANPPIRSGINSNADYSRKVNVRVSDILTRQQAAGAATFGFRSVAVPPQPNPNNNHAKQSREANLPRAQIVVRPQNSPPANALMVPLANSHSVIREDRSWPPEHSQEFAKVNVRVMGQKLDTKALLHLTPTSDHASVKKLKKILGPQFQTNWMSIDAPEKPSGKNTRSLSSELLQPDEALMKAVEHLNFTILRPSSNSDHLVPLTLTTEQTGLLKDWLLQRATCKMEFIWEDLGSLFWPRWIKRGICVNTVPCSWPPGMRCRPSSSKTLKLLRWACSDDSRQFRHSRKRWVRNQPTNRHRRARRDGPSNNNRRRFAREERRSKRVRRLIRRLSLTANGYHCEWIPHEFPVTDRCSCGCE